MGREVRRVPPGWEHPRYTKKDARELRCIGEYRPCFDEDYDAAAKKWDESYMLWREGKHPNQVDWCRYFWEYDPPPDATSYRPAFTGPATWYQVYETVSEGCPVTPPFSSLEELARYLSEHGDFWYQSQEREGRLRGNRKPTYEQALAMVSEGWGPSMIVERGPEGAKITGPYGEEA